MISEQRRSIFWLTLFFLTFLSAGSFAQNTVLIDSLRKEFKAATPAQRFELLTAIGFEYRYSIPDSTIIYCTKAYELGKSLRLKKELSKPLSFIGLANANKGDFPNSVKFHYEAIEVAIEQNDSVQLAFGYNNLGRMFFDEGDLVRANTNLIRSRELFEVLGNKSGLAYVYRSLANIYKSQHNLSQALEVSERAYALRMEIGDPRTIVSALVELGLVYEAMGDGDRALIKFRKADSLARGLHDKVTEAEVRLGMAEILFQQKKYDEANNIAEGVLQVVTAQTNQKLFLRANLVRGQYYIQRGQLAKAIPVLESTAAASDNNLTSKREAYFLLADIFKKQKDKTKEDQYTNAWKILNEKLQNTDLTMQVNQLKFKLDLERIEKENELLKLARSKDLEVISTQRNQNILLLITVISVTAALFLLWLHSRRRRVIHEQLAIQNEQIKRQGEEIENKNKDLSHRNEELSALNYEKDTLMNIVAHDLKSPINHILGVTQIMELEGDLSAHQKNYVRLIKEATHSGLDLIVDLLDVNALEETKGIINQTAFDWTNLFEEQIKSHETVAAAKQIILKVKNTGNVNVISEPKYITRILDNLISNAIKFSKKGTVVFINAEAVNGKVNISVKDNGPGFSEDDKKFLFQRFRKLSARPTGGESSNGLGLTIVKTLVDRLGGEIELRDVTPQGSEFRVSIPVKIAEKPAL